MSTRVNGAPDPDRYIAMKLPRIAYRKHFARDRDGNYAGTEPEREWSEADLERDFGVYQHMPLRSIPGHAEFGEGDEGKKGWSGGLQQPLKPRLF